MPLAAADNRRMYQTVAFDSWASRTDLTAVEEMLVDRFLDKHGRTVEAGTGAGRILFDLDRRGFGDLHGFDYVPGFIDVAKRRDPAHAIDFTVQDAVDLDYSDGEFDQAVYLQQVLCFIEDAADRRRAMDEAARILRRDGTALFSFLCFEARMNLPLYAAFARYLGVQRRLRRRDVSLQYQPWLKGGNRPNLSALLDRAPYVYWYRLREALGELDHAGFDITWTASTAQIEREPETALDPETDDPARLHGMVYVACRRR